MTGPTHNLFSTTRFERLVRIAADEGIDRSRLYTQLPVPFGDSECVTSSLQRRLCLLERLAPRSLAYHVPLALRLRGRIDVDALRTALDSVVSAHEILRTRLVEINGVPVQSIDASAPVPLTIEQVDSVDDLVPAYVASASALMRQPFDLAAAPPWRATLMRAAEDDCCLAFVFHHAIVDGWSLDVFLADLATAYRGMLDATTPQSHDDVQYAEFAAWQHVREAAGLTDGDVDYWVQALAGARTVDLGSHRRSSSPHAGGVVRRTLDTDLAQRLASVAASEQASTFSVGLAAWAAWLRHRTGSDDLIIAAPSAGRTHPALTRVIGPVVNTLALRLGVSSTATFRGLVREAMEITRAARAHEHAPIERVFEHLRPGRAPVAQVAFARERRPQLPPFPGLTPSLITVDHAAVKTDLALSLARDGDRWALAMEYSDALFSAEEADAALRDFTSFIEPLASNPSLRLSKWGRGSFVEDSPQVSPLNDSRPHYETVPLTPVQTRVWIDQQRSPDVPLYNVAITVAIDGPVDRDAFGRAFGRLVQETDALRLSFAETSDGVVQRLTDRVDASVGDIDLSMSPLDQRDAWLRGEAVAPFDLRGPLFRSILVKTGATSYVWLFVQHHLITDGWSTRLLLDRMSALYDEEHTGAPATASSTSFLAYARDHAGRVDDDAWWITRFEGVEAPRFFGTRPLKTSTAVTRTRVAFDPELARTFRAAAATLRGGSSAQGAFLLCGAAVIGLLARMTRQDRIGIGLPFHNRRPTNRDVVGLVMNVLPVGVDCTPDLTFAALCERLGAELRQVLRHADSLPPAGVRDRACDVLLNVQATNVDRFCGHPAALDWIHTGHERESLTIQFHDLSDGRIGFDLQTHDDVFDADAREQLAALLLRMIRGCVRDRETRVADVPLLEGADQERALAASRGPVVPEALAEPVIARILRRADRHPMASAIVDCASTMTYGELAQRARRIAHGLRRNGLGREDVVAVCLERSPEFVCAILGTLAAGAAYLPIDPTWPRARRDQVTADAAARRTIVRSSATESLAPNEIDIEALLAAVDSGPLPRRENGDLAYVIYTSGSTDTPKGVEITDRSLTNYAAYAAAAFDLSPRDRVLQFASLTFDTAVEEIFPTLAAGATLILRDDAMIATPRAFVSRLDELGVTVVNLPTSYWHALVDANVAVPRCVRLMLVGGEAMREEVVEQWHRMTAPSTRLLNGYGPTEATVVTTFADLKPERRKGVVSIGTPIWNVDAFVMESSGALAPDGHAGELFIGGAGLARGYRGSPSLTASRFVHHPIAPDTPLYRTGDLVRRRRSGELEFLGRLDDQVKLRGYRVDPGEIEARLRAHASVADATVVVSDRDTSRARLIAYVVAANRAALNGAELRAHLRSALPDFMIPSELFERDSLPRSSSGKVDRSVLLEGARPIQATSDSVPPRTEIEREVAAIWGAVLGRTAVGAFDNFFDSGGHSLVATQLIARVSDAFGVTLPLRTIFDRPTVAGIAESIEALRTQTPARPAGAIAIADAAETIPAEPFMAPATPAQHRLWIAADADPTSIAYHVARAIDVPGHIDLATLERSVALIAARHESLRTVFTWVDGSLMQVIAPPQAPRLDVVSMVGAAADEVDAAIRAEAQQPFDLATGPLCRWRVLRLRDRDVVCLTLHHIICDGWSLSVLARELATAYAAFAAGRRPDLGTLPLQYRHAVPPQTRPDVDSIEFWRHTLSGLAPTLPLPFDAPRPDRRTGRGGRLIADTGHRAGALVAEIARDEQTTPFVVLLSTFAIFLHRWCAAADIPIGMPVSGRESGDLGDVIGLFVNTVVARWQLTGDMAVRDAIRAGHAIVREALAHQDAPFETVVQAVQPVRVPGEAPLFQVMFSLQGDADDDAGLRSLGWTSRDVHTDTAKVDLTAFVHDRGDRFEVAFEFSRDRFATATIGAALRAFVTFLDSALATPSSPIDRVPWLAGGERDAALAAAFGPARAYPGSTPVNRLFRRVAAERRTAIAFEDGAVRTSYAQLAQDAMAIGGALRGVGIEEGDRVAILMPRGVSLIASMIGILDAGAAYVPIDPGYPAERIHFMLRDSRARAVLTAGTPPVDCAGLPTIDVHRVKRTLHLMQHSDGVSGADAAYVMYTSGSTGTPKGVIVPHRAITRLVINTDYCQIAADDRVAQASNTSFDAATFEIWGALLNGATLVSTPADIVASPRLLADHLRRQRISVLFVTTAVFNRMSADLADGFATLRVLLFGGEMANAASVRRVLSEGAPASLVHVYGPTETTTFATAHHVTALAADAVGVPIGRPIANSSAFVLDGHRQPVPQGVVGELYIGGDGVAIGYSGHDELTGMRFVEDPFRGAGRLYRTGDRCRIDADGLIEFVGRADRQVKLRGFRIEPGEIEQALGTHPAVTGSLAGIVGDDDERELVACVTVADAHVDSEALRQHLRARLPAFSIPATIAVTDVLPVTVNGKIERSQLRFIDRAHEQPRRSRAPRDPLEAELARIWEDLLHVSPIGRDDDFFELGGHSLLAAAMIDRVEALLGRRVPISTLMRGATIEALATAYWEAETSRGSLLVPVRADGERPPLFFVHGDLNGGGLFCTRLARQLDSSQPFYTLAPIDADADARSAGSIQGMASAYAAEIARARPDGPLVLGGYCHGALVAFEVARLLSREREVTDVLLVHPSPIESRLVAVDRLVRTLSHLRGGDEAAHTQRMVRAVTALQFLRHARGSEIADWAWRRSLRMFRRRSNTAGPGLAARPRTRALRHDPVVWERVVHAVMTYVPRSYDGAISLFVPPGPRGAADRGWSRFARDVAIVPVPGDHRTCVTTYAETLGLALEARLADSYLPAARSSARAASRMLRSP